MCQATRYTHKTRMLARSRTGRILEGDSSLVKQRRSSIVLSCADLAARPTSTLSSQLRITAASSLTDQSLRRGTDSDPFYLGRDQKQSHVTGQIFVVLAD